MLRQESIFEKCLQEVSCHFHPLSVFYYRLIPLKETMLIYLIWSKSCCKVSLIKSCKWMIAGVYYCLRFPEELVCLEMA